MFNFRNYDDFDDSFVKILQDNVVTLGAKVQFIMDSDVVYTAFGNDVTASYASDLVIALKNIKVLIYNGQDDVVVNTPGVMQYLNSLNWDGIAAWKRTKKTIWTIHG